MMTEDRAAPARRARTRNSQERKAAALREAGWTCVPPEFGNLPQYLTKFGPRPAAPAPAVFLAPDAQEDVE